MANKTITLTRAEYGAVSEAIRYAQEDHAENSLSGRGLNPALSRVQRKLGEVPGID